MSGRLAARASGALTAAAFVVLACARVHACEPCGSTLDLPASLRRAEVVAVVKRVDASGGGGAARDEAQCDELSVERVLKGEFEGERLTVRRWYGMCPYGVILGRGTYVVILVKGSEGDYGMARVSAGCEVAPGGRAGKAELYVPVEQGCAVKSLRVESGSVEAEGVRLTLEEFADRYGLRAGGRGAGGARPPADLFYGAWPGGRFGAGLFARGAAGARLWEAL